MLPCGFSLFTFRRDRLILIQEFLSCSISRSVGICNTSFSKSVRFRTSLQTLSECHTLSLFLSASFHRRHHRLYLTNIFWFAFLCCAHFAICRKGCFLGSHPIYSYFCLGPTANGNISGLAFLLRLLRSLNDSFLALNNMA